MERYDSYKDSEMEWDWEDSFIGIQKIGNSEMGIVYSIKKVTLQF